MALRGPSVEDQRKLHAEVNQIVNQRFQLTTVAITVFGVVVAWLLPRQAPQAGQPVGAFAFAGSVLLLVLLFVIFLYGRLLTAMLRVISGYLVITNTSGWEADWASYRDEGPHVGYTRPQSIVFTVLGVLSIAVPYAIATFYSAALEPAVGSYVVVVVGLTYLAAVVILGFLNFGVSDKTATKKWEQIRQRQPNPPLQPTALN